MPGGGGERTGASPQQALSEVKESIAVTPSATPIRPGSSDETSDAGIGRTKPTSRTPHRPRAKGPS